MKHKQGRRKRTKPLPLGVRFARKAMALATADKDAKYAKNIAREFVEYLRPMTLVGHGWRNVPFIIRVSTLKRK